MIRISDDGDETLIVTVEDQFMTTEVGRFGHSPHGWEGLTEIIDAIHQLAEALGVHYECDQDIV